MFRRLLLLPSLALLACGGPVVTEDEAASAVLPISFVQEEPAAAPALPQIAAERIETLGEAVVFHDATWATPLGVLRAPEVRMEGLARERGGLTATRVTARDLSVERADGLRLRLASVTLTGLTLPDSCAGAELACARWTLLAATDAALDLGALRWRADLLTVADVADGRVGLARAQGVHADRPAPVPMPTLPRLAARMAGAPLGLAGFAEADALRADAVSVAGADLGALFGGGTLGAEELRVVRARLSRGGRPLSQAAVIAMRDAQLADGVLMRLSLEVEGARADLGARLGPAAEAAARAEGLNAVRGGASLRFARSEDGARFEADWEAGGMNAGELTISLAGDVAASVAGGRMAVRDAGALDGFFAVAAAAEGQDPALLRRQIVGALTFAAMQAAREEPTARDAGEALLAFVARGGTIEATLRPDEPIAPPALAAAPPGEAMRRLGLDVSVRN